MAEPVETGALRLSKLAINRAQRPTGSRRGRWGLAAILGTVAVISVGAAWWYYQTTGVNIAAALGNRPAEVNVMVVPQVNAEATQVVLVANGKIVSDRRVNVATKVSGQIVELNVEQGDKVKEGDILARVEDVTYRAQRDEAVANVARRRHEIAQARAEHTRSEAAVREKQAEFEFQQRNYERLERLHKIDQASEFEFSSAKNLYEAAEAAHDVAAALKQSAASSVEVAESDLQAAEAIRSIAQKRFDDCAIGAPISGVILNRNAQVGDFLAAEGGRGANANAQLVEIADMTLLRVEIDASERDVHRLFPNQRARVTPDADKSATYDGHVMWIDPIGDYAKATVQVKVRIKDPGPNLRVEGSAKVEFLAGAASSDAAGAATLWLPKAAVKLNPGSGEGEVFTVTKGQAVAHPVKVGARTEKNVEIKSGVLPGMTIVAENLDKIKSGTAVKVMRTISMDDL